MTGSLSSNVDWNMEDGLADHSSQSSRCDVNNRNVVGKSQSGETTVFAKKSEVQHEQTSMQELIPNITITILISLHY